MINLNQLRDLVIIPTLDRINLNSAAAVQLLLGTALVESHCEYLKQLGGGPALGIYQMEPATLYDIYANYLRGREGLLVAVSSLIPGDDDREQQLTWNLAFATAMARIKYYRSPMPLPEENDALGMAEMWKKVYNTERGKGKQTDFIDLFVRYVKQ